MLTKYKVLLNVLLNIEPEIEYKFDYNNIQKQIKNYLIKKITKINDYDCKTFLIYSWLISWGHVCISGWDIL